MGLEDVIEVGVEDVERPGALYAQGKADLAHDTEGDVGLSTDSI